MNAFSDRLGALSRPPSPQQQQHWQTPQLSSSSISNINEGGFVSEGTGGEGLTVPSDADAHGFGYAGASHDPGWLSDTSGAPLDAFMPEWGFGDSFEQPHNEIDTSTTLPLWPGPQLVADCPHWDRSFIFPYLPATDHPWNASQIHSFDRYDMQTFHLPSTSTVASPLPKHSCAELPPLPSEDAPLSEQAFESPSSGTSMYSQSDCDTSSPEGLPSAESEETPVPPMLSRRSPPSSASLSPEPPQTALRSEQDRVLVSLRKKGLPYKEIMKQHDFGGVTESTLRGRYRARTKSAAERPRQPIWTCKDVELLVKAVDLVMHTSLTSKVPWKFVAEYIYRHGGTHKFAYATCRRKYDEVTKLNV